MRAEILTIGDELCRGDVVDTNSSWLAHELWRLGVTVSWMTSCRDQRADMERAFTQATDRADLVVVSGGLGPTEDDLTVDVLANLLGVVPVVDEPARAVMEKRFAEANFKLTDNNMRQVQVPAGAQVFANPTGLAPGFEVSLQGVPVICMPGVPRELKAIFEQSVRPQVIAARERRGEHIERVATEKLRIFGAGESHIAAALEGLAAREPGVSFHYRVPFPEVLLQVVVRDREESVAAERLARVVGEIRGRLGHRVYGTGEDTLAVVLGRALAARQATMVTAESCTGGMIGALMTAVPGSSRYFLGGAITYSNEEKTRQLGVEPAVFEQHGAVSEACVEAMASGARSRFGADMAVAVSGVAGPGGGSPDKPVGTVWLAVAGPNGVRTKRMNWPTTRERVRQLAAHWAMALTLRELSKVTAND